MSNLFNTWRKEPKERADKEPSKNTHPNLSQLELIAASKQKDLNGLDPEALDNRFRKMLLNDMNLGQQKAEDLVKTMDRSKKIQLIMQSEKSHQNTDASPSYYCAQMSKGLSGKAETNVHKTLVSLRVSLSGQNVSWIKDFGTEGGFHMLVSMMERFLATISKLSATSDGSSADEEETLNAFLEAIKCIKCILNTKPGLSLLLRKDSKVCGKLVDAVYEANAAPSNAAHRALYEQLRLDAVTLLYLLVCLKESHTEGCEITGHALVIRDVTDVAERRNVPRFTFVIDCLRGSSHDMKHKALLFIHLLLNGIDDSEWQIRMIWRNEIMRTGLAKLMPEIERAAEEDQKIRSVLDNYEQERKADYEELSAKHDKLCTDFETPQQCNQFLMASCLGTDAECFLHDIFLKLCLVVDLKFTRAQIFDLINACIGIIIDGDAVIDPEFGRKAVIVPSIDDILERISKDSQKSALIKRLDAANAAKLEAVAWQSRYYQKLQEYQDEAKKLREHISDPKKPLPSATECTLPAPSEAASAPITGGLPPVTGGPPPPPPLAGAGGAPPPPPPPGPPPPLKKGGGPPPPPGPPPPLGKGGPPPPPPPPPPPGGPRPPPGPPPPPGAPRAPAFGNPTPEIPNFLKRKTPHTSDVPLKKIAWTSAIIKPNNVSEKSIWATITEDEVASKEVFETVKSRFAAKKAAADANPQQERVARKVKKPLVIHDDKILQALAILQGSCKLSFEEWFKAIMEIDEGKLNSTLIEQLRTALPPADMMNALRECSKKDLENVPEGEKFAATLAAIKGLPLRLQLMKLKMCWRESFDELKGAISTISEACDEVRTSDGFRAFISLILLVGNFMSRTKSSKDTFAFEMRVLTKLVDTKDVDNKQTLLHVLIALLGQQFKGKYTSFVSDDFLHIVRATKVNVKDIPAQLNELSQSVKKLSTCLATYTKQAGNDMFPEKMGPFMTAAQRDLEVVDSMHKTMQSKWEQLQAYLCFDPKKYPMEDLFGDLKLFKEQYENALREIDADREKKQAAGKKRKPFKTLQVQNTAPMEKQSSTESDEAAGVLDKIEQLIGEGRYRVSGTPRTPKSNAQKKLGENQTAYSARDPQAVERNLIATKQEHGYRIRRKGKETVTVKGDTTAAVKENSHPASATGSTPSTEELLKRLKEL